MSNLKKILVTIIILFVLGIPAGGLAEEPHYIDEVYFANNQGIHIYSSETGLIEPFSTFPSYELEFSPAGELYVGNGGVEALNTGINTSGIFLINSDGSPTLFSDLPAEDIEFAPDGSLITTNRDGVFRVLSDGSYIQLSDNPSTQFAFQTSTVIRASNGAAYRSIFGQSTDLIDLVTGDSTQLGNDGGEDIEILDDGTLMWSGQGGLFARKDSVQRTLISGLAVFDFEVTPSGRIYFGNPNNYSIYVWQRGLYTLPVNGTQWTKLNTFNINSIEVITTVINPNSPPEITVDISDLVVDEGELALNSGDVIDQDDDTLTLTSSVGVVSNNEDGTWRWSYETVDGPSESQLVTISADDGQGGMSQVDFELIVNNIAPSIELIGAPDGPVNFYEQPIGILTIFSDPAGAFDAPYECTLDYGDGFGSQAGIVVEDICSGYVSYTSPGVYSLEVVVSDKDGGSGTSYYEYVVVYDASGSFITGGGWITSPEGSYRPDPTLTGKATFGFVSKYKKGANIPTGETEFQFKVADLNFHSESYQWLVVAGPKAQFKGVGTINGEGVYGFILTAIDASLTPSTDADLFRIKIWDIATDVLIYDNNIGPEDNADPSTTLGGGSIKVHKAK